MLKKCIALFLLMCASLFVLQPTVLACTGFIIGKDLTEDGSWLYGRTEDLEPNHNKTFVVYPRRMRPMALNIPCQRPLTNTQLYQM